MVNQHHSHQYKPVELSWNTNFVITQRNWKLPKYVGARPETEVYAVALVLDCRDLLFARSDKILYPTCYKYSNLIEVSFIEIMYY